MEITSHFVENGDLGQLHITRLTPPKTLPNELGVHFGGVNSRTTLDTIGSAYIIAEERGMVVDIIDRPGNGSSTLPESANLRKDYKNFKFVAVRDAIIEAQAQQDEFFNSAEKIHTSGMSLGGAPAVIYLDGIGERATSTLLIDSVALRIKANKYEGVGRYFIYLAVEAAANLTGLKPNLTDLFALEAAIIASYNRFREDNPNIPVNPIMTKEAKKAEFNELCRLTEGMGLSQLFKIMQNTVDHNGVFEMRASRSAARQISDNKSVSFINQAFEGFDSSNIGQQSVTYGFKQDNTHWWHDLAVAPSSLRALITTPIAHMQKRLK